MNQIFLIQTPTEIFKRLSTVAQLESWLKENDSRLQVDPFLFNVDWSVRTSPEEPIFFGKILGAFLSTGRKEYLLYLIENTTDISRLRSNLGMLSVTLTGFFRF